MENYSPRVRVQQSENKTTDINLYIKKKNVYFYYIQVHPEFIIVETSSLKVHAYLTVYAIQTF